jgi:hypothetical protein
MTAARLRAALLTGAACLGAWIVRAELGDWRGALVWDLRFVVVGVAAVLLLSLAEALGGDR